MGVLSGYERGEKDSPVQHLFNIMVNGSFKVVQNRQRISYNGVASIYIRVKINGRKKEVPLNIRWPVDKFDSENGLCRRRHTDDQEADDNNIVIRGEIARVNEIFRYYRLSGGTLTVNKFITEYRQNFSKESFTAYFEKKSKARLRDKDISIYSYKNEKNTLNKLKAFRADIQFSDMDEKWAGQFDRFLRKEIKSKSANNQNSRWAIHKVVKTYIRLAVKDGISFTNPYTYFSISMTGGSWRAIFEDDIRKLHTYYIRDDISPSRRRVVRGFLFACMTGLRISDLERVREDWNVNGILTFIPFKGRKKNKVLEVPMNSLARELFADALGDHREGFGIFYVMSEQKANKALQKVGAELGIRTRLHHHVARHSFITLYYNKTKDLLSASKFAGHESIQQTEKYTHQDRDEMKEKMRAMDGIV